MDLPVDPRALELRRGERYDGGGFHVALAELDPADARRVRLLHDRAEEVYRTWLAVRDGEDWGPLHRRAVALDRGEFPEAARRVGDATPPEARTGEADGVLHDVRGGALTALLAEVELLEGADDRERLEGIALLARDQAKMMRNGVVDVAPELRAADERERPHRIRDLLETWAGRRFAGATVSVELHTDRVMAARCLEASAVDRVLYNVVGNAAAHAADGRVGVEVREVAEDILRVLVTNRVDDAARAWLEARAEDGRLPVLFERGVTRSGRGLGLPNARAFVAAAFGLGEVGPVVARGYIGAVLRGDRVGVWFHWPAVGRFV